MRINLFGSKSASVLVLLVLATLLFGCARGFSRLPSAQNIAAADKVARAFLSAALSGDVVAAGKSSTSPVTARDLASLRGRLLGSEATCTLAGAELAPVRGTTGTGLRNGDVGFLMVSLRVTGGQKATRTDTGFINVKRLALGYAVDAAER